MFDWFDKYKKMLEDKTKERKEPMRSSSTEVENILIDLYWALTQDKAQFTPMTYVDITIERIKEAGGIQ